MSADGTGILLEIDQEEQALMTKADTYVFYVYWTLVAFGVVMMVVNAALTFKFLKEAKHIKEI